jgi:hypothetical protein|tara:strand:+ start:401 stop:817 length:417 start_codon:yes stop_codon:yes gene_type:complete
MDTNENNLRANLTFSVDVNRTMEVVRHLTTLEGKRLVKVVEGWGDSFSPEKEEPELLEGFRQVRTQIIDVLEMLGQYENMVVGFMNQSSEPLTAPAPDITVDQLKEKVEEIEKFGGFIDKINEQNEEEEADEEPEEDV